MTNFYRSKIFLILLICFSAKSQTILKLNTEKEYSNYLLDLNERCMSKDKIIELEIKQIYENLNTYNAFNPTMYFENIQNISNLWSCHMEKLHYFKDSNKSLPTMNEINKFIDKVSSRGGEIFQIRGKQKYYGLIKMKYNYELEINKENLVVIRIRVKFNDSKLNNDEKNTFQRYLLEAQTLWNNSLPHGFKFELVQVSDPYSKTHYRVKLWKNIVTGLYNKFWFYSLGGESFAHEIGHMLGLNEEYNVFKTNISIFSNKKSYELNLAETISDKKRRTSFLDQSDRLRSYMCFLNSVACSADTIMESTSERGSIIQPSIFPYQLYHILRRLPVE